MAMQEAGQDVRPDDRRQQAAVRSGAELARYRDRNGRSGDGGLTRENRLATALGWFSIGLGVAQLAAPAGMARLIGVRDDRQTSNVMRAVGLREIGSGIGILTRPRPAGWVWTRVAGDVMDLALLGRALASDHARPGRVAAATAAVAGVAVLDALCAERLSERHRTREDSARARRAAHAPEERTIRITRVITIGKPAEEIYRFWRHFENLPRFMRHLESVAISDERHSHWKAKAPFGRTVEWEAEITEDRPNQRLAWRSLGGADVANSGSVAFEGAPGGRGTVVRVELEYEPPAGVIGATIAKLFGEEPGQQVQEDLRALKQLMETGEVVQSEDTVQRGGAARPPARAPASRR